METGKKQAKWLLIIVSLIILLISSVCGATEAKATMKEKAGDNKIVLEYKFSEPVISSRAGYDLVQIEDLELYERTGAPIVPVRPVRALVPFGKKVVTCRVIALDTRRLPGVYRLTPAQKPYPLSYKGQVEWTEPNPAIYNQAKPWPGIDYEQVGTQSKRGYQIFTVNLFPLQYVPTTGEIYYTAKLRLEIDLADSAASSVLKPSKEIKSTLKRMVDNPSVLDTYPTKGISGRKLGAETTPLSGGPYEYVIITNGDLNDAPGPWNFQALRDAKIAKGMTATIVTTEWIYANYDGTRPDGGNDNQTRIRNFLIDAYQTWDTEYVLLGGTNAIVPARMFWADSHAGPPPGEMPVDMYYGCVNPPDCNFDYDHDGLYGEPNDGVNGGDVDLYAEVYVGRAAIENATELENFIKKTLTYDSNNNEYLPRICMLSEPVGSVYTKEMMEQIRLGGFYDGYFTYGFKNHNRPTFFDFNTIGCLPENPSVCWPLHNEDYNWPRSDLIDLMNVGIHVFNHVGHGTEPCMSDEKDFCVDYIISELNNTDYFFVYSQTCNAGGFDTTNCFAEVITSMEHGAFGVVMNAREGIGNQGGTDGPSQRFNRQFWDAVLREDENTWAIGWANQHSKEMNHWDTDEGAGMRWCYYELNLFGDPEQQFRFEESPLTLQKTDDIDANDCVGPGDEINYRIDYSYPSRPNYPDINNVNITDHLPDEVEFVSSLPEPNEIIDSNIIWHIGTLHPGDAGIVTLKVNVKCAEPGGTITNCCRIENGEITYRIDCEDTNVYSPTLTMDDVPDETCVSPGDDVNYSIYYAANGYGDTNVKIIDDLPTEVNYVSSDPCGDYDPEAHKITWDIDFPPEACGCVELVVRVNIKAMAGGEIPNHCELKGDCLDLPADESTPVCCWYGPVTYVDADATGGNNGYLWENAFTNLQDALSAAQDCGYNEIRVAEGIYKPDVNSAYPNGSGDREATFELVNGVTIKGGYAGFGFPNPNVRVRDIRRYETVLSGDLEGNDHQVDDPLDLKNDPFRADNSYHVVTGSNINSSAVIDGFTITGGNANGTDMYGDGGGMYNESGSPIVINCTFSENSAYACGGGMYNEGGSPMVRNCIFNRNLADLPSTSYGGGIGNNGSSLTVTNCTFIGNMAYGIYSVDSDVKVTNCILWGNEGGQISGCSATYSNIQGEGHEDTGNIDKEPMFAVDGYHLTLCSPCIDAGTNTPPGGLPEEDIDGESRIIDGDCNGNARVDMGVDEYYLIDCNATLRAHCPGPDCRAVNVPLDVVLCWRPGVDANKHDVYFGTDFNDVNDANEPNTPPGKGQQDSNSFDPCTGLLEFDTTYYWRIDEVNDANIWQGDLWHFRTVPDYNIVDDFNKEYTSSYPNRLKDTWKDYFMQDPPVTSAVVDDVVDPNHDGPKAMSFWYRNDVSPYYSEARATIGTGTGKLNIDPNWLGMDANKALVLWFYGTATNDANGPMYVTLTDNGDVSGTVEYAGDMNDIRVEGWHEWNIDLQDFVDDNNVTLSNIKKITIGIGDGTPGTNDGIDDIVYFDDIRLYKRRCRTDLVAGDIDGDCRVGWRDLEIMTDKWLEIGCCEDLYKDDKVNFNDYAILANSWLVEGLWPYEE